MASGPGDYLFTNLTSLQCRTVCSTTTTNIFHRSISNSRGTKAYIGNCVTPAGSSLTRESNNFDTFFLLAVIKISVCYLQIIKEESFTFKLVCKLFQMAEICSRKLAILCCRFETTEGFVRKFRIGERV